MDLQDSQEWVLFRAKEDVKDAHKMRCDNPGCVNPDHLSVGTPKENFDDMVSKGRQPKGWGSHKFKKAVK